MATYDLRNGIPSTILTGDILNCPYSGRIISLPLQKGTYLLEAWGGGTPNEYSSWVGHGGYSHGKLTLQSTTTLYLVTGGSGVVPSSTSTGASGGYNGGGDSERIGGGLFQFSAVSGGGASHIATATGLLSSLSGNQSSILLVAGGAGGSTYESGSFVAESTGRAEGGGSSGMNGDRLYHSSYGTVSYSTAAGGGTQSGGGSGGISRYASGQTQRIGSAGSFGQGGGACTDTDTYLGLPTGYGGGGGGGGYYGGGGGSCSYGLSALSMNQRQCMVTGGGGSGFLSSTLTESATQQGSTSISYPDGTNGYIRITVIEMTAGVVDVSYNGSSITSFYSSSSISVTYNGSTIATLSKGSSKTLSCSGCVMASDVGIGGKTLSCSGKVMNSNVVINYS